MVKKAKIVKDNKVTFSVSGNEEAVRAIIKTYFGNGTLNSIARDYITGRPELFTALFTLYISEEEIKIELDEAVRS